MVQDFRPHICRDYHPNHHLHPIHSFRPKGKSWQTLSFVYVTSNFNVTLESRI